MLTSTACTPAGRMLAGGGLAAAGAGVTSAALDGGKRAELSNLRVLTTSSGEWRSVRACYELREQWHLVRIGTTPGCLR